MIFNYNFQKSNFVNSCNVLQATFDKAVNHLRKQNTRSYDPKLHKNLMFGPNNLTDPIAIYIRPNKINEIKKNIDINCASAKEIFSLGLKFLKKNLTSEQCHLLIQMQLIHDNGNASSWEDNFIIIAKLNKLNLPPKKL